MNLSICICQAIKHTGKENGIETYVFLPSAHAAAIQFTYRLYPKPNFTHEEEKHSYPPQYNLSHISFRTGSFAFSCVAYISIYSKCFFLWKVIKTYDQLNYFIL